MCEKCMTYFFLASGVNIGGPVSPLLRCYSIVHYTASTSTLEWSPIQVIFREMVFPTWYCRSFFTVKVLMSAPKQCKIFTLLDFIFRCFIFIPMMLQRDSVMRLLTATFCCCLKMLFLLRLKQFRKLFCVSEDFRLHKQKFACPCGQR